MVYRILFSGTVERFAGDVKMKDDARNRSSRGIFAEECVALSPTEQEIGLMRQSYADQVYNHIKAMILSGNLRQGDKIVEDKIAKRFGVSRTPIREALTRLQLYGLVHLQPRSYAEVVTIDGSQARDIADVRFHLERMAFGLLVERNDAATIEPLQRAAADARRALDGGDRAGYFEHDSTFHIAAAAGSGNGELALLYRRFESKVQLLRIAQEVPIERLEIYAQQHFDLIDLVAAGRRAAVDELLHVHIIHDLGPRSAVASAPGGYRTVRDS